LPREEREYSLEERRDLQRHPLRRKLKWYRHFKLLQDPLWGKTVGSRAHETTKAKCPSFIEAQIQDPKLRELVTPSYPYECKRLVKSSNFYPALNSPNVELIPFGVGGVTEDSLVDTQGQEREVDVDNLAAGFRTTEYLATLRAVDPSGESVRDSCRGNP
jgi:cation diffusion facilitator CzcD-associated flavoprotein CzcO